MPFPRAQDGWHINGTNPEPQSYKLNTLPIAPPPTPLKMGKMISHHCPKSDVHWYHMRGVVSEERGILMVPRLSVQNRTCLISTFVRLKLHTQTTSPVRGGEEISQLFHLLRTRGRNHIWPFPTKAIPLTLRISTGKSRLCCHATMTQSSVSHVGS